MPPKKGVKRGGNKALKEDAIDSKEPEVDRIKKFPKAQDNKKTTSSTQSPSSSDSFQENKHTNAGEEQSLPKSRGSIVDRVVADPLISLASELWAPVSK